MPVLCNISIVALQNDCIFSCVVVLLLEIEACVRLNSYIDMVPRPNNTKV